MEEAGRIYLENSSMEALREAQAAFAGEAERLGLETEENVVTMLKELQRDVPDETLFKIRDVKVEKSEIPASAEFVERCGFWKPVAIRACLCYHGNHVGKDYERWMVSIWQSIAAV